MQYNGLFVTVYIIRFRILQNAVAMAHWNVVCVTVSRYGTNIITYWVIIQVLICYCVRSGKECQCYSGANTTSSACKPAGDERACSGNGTCLCDKCKCSEDAEVSACLVGLEVRSLKLVPKLYV